MKKILGMVVGINSLLLGVSPALAGPPNDSDLVLVSGSAVVAHQTNGNDTTAGAVGSGEIESFQVGNGKYARWKAWLGGVGLNGPLRPVGGINVDVTHEHRFTFGGSAQADSQNIFGSLKLGGELSPQVKNLQLKPFGTAGLLGSRTTSNLTAPFTLGVDVRLTPTSLVTLYGSIEGGILVGLGGKPTTRTTTTITETGPMVTADSRSRTQNTQTISSTTNSTTTTDLIAPGVEHLQLGSILKGAAEVRVQLGEGSRFYLLGALNGSRIQTRTREVYLNEERGEERTNVNYGLTGQIGFGGAL